MNLNLKITVERSKGRSYFLHNSKLNFAGAGQCDSPFGMEDGSIGDNEIIASSSFNESSRASQARLHLRNDNSTAGAWCATQNKVVSHTSFLSSTCGARWHSRAAFVREVVR